MFLESLYLHFQGDYMDEMIMRWIKETLREYERAKDNQNLFRLHEMNRLLKELRTMRDRLINSAS